MSGGMNSEAATKRARAGFGFEEEKMSGTGTIGSTETGKGNRGASPLAHGLGPKMFSPLRIEGIPDILKGKHAAQVINMPMGPGCSSTVMGDSCPEPSGAERTSHINKMSGMKPELTEPAYLDG